MSERSGADPGIPSASEDGSDGAHRCELIVVTHGDPEALTRCVRAALASSAALGSVRVIDTAGVPPAAIAESESQVELSIRHLESNVGPAGGWAEGLRGFLESGKELAWLMDDDCVAQPGALEAAIAALADVDVVQSTMVARGTGRLVPTQGWCGVLVPRRVVEVVGLPDEALVWWTEDTEYLQWRIPRAGFRVVRCPDAVVEVSLRPERAAKPAWKYYYESRNQVAYRIRTQRSCGSGQPVPRHLTRRVRWWRAFRAASKLAGRALVVERDGRSAKFAMVLRGAVHGLRGVTGLTVDLGEADRARTAKAMER